MMTRERAAATTTFKGKVTVGKVDADAFRESGVDKRVSTRAERISAEYLKHMSPAGALNLQPLLDKRRLEFGIVDELFSVDAVYQRLLLWQIIPGEYEEGTFGKGSLVQMSDQQQARELREAPRGIIVSAGTDALDFLLSHGMDVGNIVWICEEAPYGIQVAIVASKRQKLMIVDVGDICASEDLATARAAGECQVVLDLISEPDNPSHKLVDAEGKPWSPMRNKTPKVSTGF